MEIREQLIENGFPILKLAQQLGVNRSAVYQSINGEGSRCIRVFIARLLKTKPSQLWAQNSRFSLVLDDALYVACDDGVSLPF